MSGSPATPMFVDLTDPALEAPSQDVLPGVVVALCPGAPPESAAPWLDHATFTLTEEPTADRRVVQVDSIDSAVAAITENVASRPLAAAVCDDVLRADSARAGTLSGLITESLAYSTLQAGPEFIEWLAGQGPREMHIQDDPVLLDRGGSSLAISFNRPARHNAFSNALRAGLIDALTVALADPTLDTVTLSGQGKSFCSGGDLTEFGTFTDPANSHIARTRHSPGLLLDAVAERLGPNFRARVHGAVLGSGLEMASFCPRVSAHPDTIFGLPELRLGLLPGAGGTVSIPRRIGRWRTAFLVLSGRRVDANTALDWGLIDSIED
ncbi:enoyl-CoA hydratase/isomerase family protein [Williamsia sp. 1135]|uniref:enoyl-CoA hydratase/isomerase family protein n=1 Tax=Williamsia sp. 1135 TaxID=1889262 RepID=UPI001F0A0BB6|nr:enoyl-CoA hydratase/isomerase family protein [Williamsia sp. 1135]